MPPPVPLARWIPLLLLGVLVLGVVVLEERAGPARSAVASVPASEREGPCRLREVVDGDTLDLRCAGRDERVRLLRIDTPEHEEPGHAAARRALGGLVRGRPLYLVFEEAERPLRDRYGRLLAYVYADELNTSLEMVRLGWSSVDQRFGAGRFGEALEAAEREARRARRGLWRPVTGPASGGAVRPAPLRERARFVALGGVGAGGPGIHRGGPAPGPASDGRQPAMGRREESGLG